MVHLIKFDSFFKLHCHLLLHGGAAAFQQLQELLGAHTGITPGTAGKKGTLQQYHQPQTTPTVPGAGLVDKVLPTRLVGHLDELVLVALSQHLLHGS